MTDTLSHTITMPAVFDQAAPLRLAESWQWISTRRLLADAVTLAGMLPLDCAGIVGIPRSGLLPATAIATQLHLPLYVLEDTTVRRCRAERGRSQEVRRRGDTLVVVDDSIASGNALAVVQQGLAALEMPVLYAVVYALPETAHLADFVAVEAEWPFFGEWNLINNPGWAREIAFDLDGIIVHDDESGGRASSPYLLPRACPIPLIVTGRPESMRAATQQQLALLGVNWLRLEMMPGSVMHGGNAIAEFKAHHYAASDCKLFLESDPWQAEDIAHRSGKAAACPRVERVYGKTPVEMPEWLRDLEAPPG